MRFPALPAESGNSTRAPNVPRRQPNRCFNGLFRFPACSCAAAAKSRHGCPCRVRKPCRPWRRDDVSGLRCRCGQLTHGTRGGLRVPRGSRQEGAHANSMIASTSTAAPSGSTLTPTAARAWRPAIAEHLDHQVGGAVDHLRLVGEVGRRGDEAAEPDDARRPDRGRRGRRLAWAMMLTAQSLAAFWPSARVTPAPSTPVTASLPASTGNCPEMNSCWPEIT